MEQKAGAGADKGGRLDAERDCFVRMIGQESMIYCTDSSNCVQSIPDQISASAWKAGTRLFSRLQNA